MKNAVFTVLLVGFIFSGTAYAQKYKVSKGKVVFFSEAALENITAYNNSAVGLFTSNTGEVAFVVPIVKFEFEKALMQEHFNEKYMHSDKYPRSTFKGKVTGFDMDKKGEQNVTVEGDLFIHGVTKKVKVPGTFEVKGNTIVMSAKFPATLADYNIERPQLLWENIAETVEVSVNFNFEKQ